MIWTSPSYFEHPFFGPFPRNTFNWKPSRFSGTSVLTFKKYHINNKINIFQVQLNVHFLVQFFFSRPANNDIYALRLFLTNYYAFAWTKKTKKSHLIWTETYMPSYRAPKLTNYLKVITKVVWTISTCVIFIFERKLILRPFNPHYFVHIPQSIYCMKQYQE